MGHDVGLLECYIKQMLTVAEIRERLEDLDRRLMALRRSL